MVEALIVLGVVGGVLVVVNVVYHLVAGRRGSEAEIGHEAGLEDGAEAESSASPSPGVSDDDEHLLLLKPLEEQEAIRAARREEELRKHPLQGLLEDVEADERSDPSEPSLR